VPPTFRYALVESSLDSQRSQQALDEPWYNPSTYVRLWENASYSLRERSDSAVSVLDLPPAQMWWHPSEWRSLDFELDEELLVLSFDASPSLEGELQASPKTLQLSVLVPDSDAQLCVDDKRAELSRGVWVVDLAVDSRSDLQVQNCGGKPVALRRVQATSAVTGDPGELLETIRRSDGVAFVSQTLEGDELVYEVVLVPPQQSIGTYRLGLHVIGLSEPGIFGVWGLDFPIADEVEFGELRVNLVDRTSRGMVNGQQIPVDLGPFELEAGTMEVQVVWWQLGNPSYLDLQRTARFERDDRGVSDVTLTPVILPSILVAP
jgi:hypothetical protein